MNAVLKEMLKSGIPGGLMSFFACFLISYFVVPLPQTAIDHGMNNGISGFMSGFMSAAIGIFVYIRANKPKP